MKILGNTSTHFSVFPGEHAMLRLFVFLLTFPALSMAGERTFGNGTLTEYLSIYDVDNSGGLSPDELQTLRNDRKDRRKTLKNRWDTNRDGKISPQEREVAKATIRRQIEAGRLERFSEVDLDRDNFLTPVEFNRISAVTDANAGTPGIATRLFDNLDLNKDGKVSSKEFLLKIDTLPVDAEDGATPLAHPRTTRNVSPDRPAR